MRCATAVLLACVAAAALPTTRAVEQKASPVEKVIGLLEKLKVESEEEGAAEAAAYDKYACFCKAQAEAKLKAIATAEEKIGFYTAKVKKLGADIKDLSKDVTETNKQKNDLMDTIVDEQGIRDKEHNAFLIKKADLVEAVRGAHDGIDLIKDRAGEMEGTKLTGLLQKAVAHNAVRMNKALTRQVTALLEKASDEEYAPEAHAFQFHGNEILETMGDLMKTFKVNKNDLEMKEMNDKHTFDMAQGGRLNQLKAFKDKIAKNEEIIAKKEEDKNKFEGMNEKAENGKAADQSFLDELVVQCENTAGKWDQRSKTRANELMAIYEALEILKGKVSKNYGANKKLTGLVSVDTEAHKGEKGHWVWVKDVSFLQTDRVNSVNRQVLRFLQRQAAKLQSDALSNLVLKIKADHFVKVRAMIKDMMAKLKADAEAEQTQKGWCDEEMEKATDKRDEHIGKMEGDMSDLGKTKARLDELRIDIAEMEEEIASLHKALNEATALREEESTENKKTVADSKAGLNAVRAAKTVLEDFYGFVQVSSRTQRASAAPKDADGNSISDLAPDTGFGDEDFEGNQDAASGIIGLIEVIESDFERTISETKDLEKEDADSFKDYKKQTESDLKSKKEEVADMKKEVNTKKGEYRDFEDNLHDHTLVKSEAIDELNKLEAPCTGGGMSYEERVKRREEEIESLRNAAKILASMSLLQRNRQ